MPESGFLIGGPTTTGSRFRPPSSSSISPHRRNHYSPLPRSSDAVLHSDNPGQPFLRVSLEEIHRQKMEKQCNEKLNEQRIKYDQLLSELTSDLELLTTQMSNECKEEDQVLPLERTIQELEQQNDRLQKSLLNSEEKFSGDLKELSMESSLMRRKVSELEYQLRSKETAIEELKCSEATLDAELKLQKQICKCHYEEIENQDALSIRLQEMHSLLNEKSAEAVRSATALRWKTIELERMGKLAGEEKQRLRDEIDEQMKALSAVKSRVMELERSLENKTMEVSKLNQRIRDGEQKEEQLQDNLMRNMERLTSLETQVFK